MWKCAITYARLMLSQLTVAMVTNPNVNTGSHSKQSSEYKQSVNSHRVMPRT